MSVKRELAQYGVVARKGLGQHFLVDRNIIHKIVEVARLRADDVVLEVGPGLGEMTALLARQARKVICVEIDPRLAAILKTKMLPFQNVEVIEEDILKLDLLKLAEAERQQIKVVANLPYQISTPLLFRLIEARKIFSELTLMLQKEVAERIVSPPGGKEYGPLSLLVQMFSEVSICFHVKPSAFYPRPKVESSVIRIRWKESPPVAVEDEQWFKNVVKKVMGYRRKTLINALKYSGLSRREASEGTLAGAGIDPQRRPGTLSLEEFLRLAQTLKGSKE
jgi:16S rRNA (adenine1518-N6/adenine1519-N6)-dimethyltransferase